MNRIVYNFLKPALMLFIIIAILSCSRPEADPEKSPCEKAKFCYYVNTDPLTVAVVDKANQSITLDSFYTIRQSNNSRINVPPHYQGRYPHNGRYPIVYFDVVDSCGEKFDFIGYLGNKEVCKASFLIRDAGCEHVILSGNPIITVYQ